MFVPLVETVGEAFVKTVFSLRVGVAPGVTTSLLLLGYIRLRLTVVLVVGMVSEVTPLVPHVLVVELVHLVPVGSFVDRRHRGDEGLMCS